VYHGVTEQDINAFLRDLENIYLISMFFTPEGLQAGEITLGFSIVLMYAAHTSASSPYLSQPASMAFKSSLLFFI